MKSHLTEAREMMEMGLKKEPLHALPALVSPDRSKKPEPKLCPHCIGRRCDWWGTGECLGGMKT